MRVLVTGGAGFVGSHLVKKLVQDGNDVTVLDNLSTGLKTNLGSLVEDGMVDFIRGDIRDCGTVRDCIKNTDRVVHLAAIASVPYSIQNPAETHEVNVDGTLNVLRECAENRVSKVVYASSCAVYGEPKIIPVSEEHSFSPTSPYAESKIASEGFCRIFREMFDLHVVCLRAFNVYGPNQRNSDYGGVITQFISRLKSGKQPIIYGDGEQSRDFIFVDDVATSIASIIRTPNGSDGIYNLGSGRATTINQVARILQSIFAAAEFSPIYMPSRPGDIRCSMADISKARKHLGFDPSTTLEGGLERLASSEAGLSGDTVEPRQVQVSRVGHADRD